MSHYWEPSRPYSSPEFQYSEILPGRLWIGEAPRKQDVETLRKLGVTDILNLTRLDEVLAVEREAQFRVHAFPFPDGGFGWGGKDLRLRAHEMMVGAVGRLDELLAGGMPTYLHCVAGISRSPTVYIMWQLRAGQARNFHEALERTLQARPIVSPNPDLVDIVRELHPGAFGRR
jgi:predicted protein tyrosine phosphatase